MKVFSLEICRREPQVQSKLKILAVKRMKKSDPANIHRDQMKRPQPQSF